MSAMQMTSFYLEIFDDIRQKKRKSEKIQPALYNAVRTIGVIRLLAIGADEKLLF